jgi:hypothetical protein
MGPLPVLSAQPIESVRLTRISSRDELRRIVKWKKVLGWEKTKKSVFRLWSAGLHRRQVVGIAVLVPKHHLSAIFPLPLDVPSADPQSARIARWNVVDVRSAVSVTTTI